MIKAITVESEMDELSYERSIPSFIEATNRLRPEFEGRYYRWAFLNDDSSTTSFDTHYLYHVAWALRKLATNRPELHVDFSSSLNFCTAAAAICEIQFYDFRPAQIFLEGLTCLKADLTSLDIATDSLASVSCMHVVEHVGLGRYGDEVDTCGDLKAIAELKRVVRPGGVLYIVAPTGLPAISFNAHRVYSAEAVVGYFSDGFDLEEFYFIPGPIEAAPIKDVSFADTLKYDYGCGCYMFRKRQAPYRK